MRTFRIILLAIFLLLASVCYAVDCADFAELEVAVHDTAAAAIVLTGSTYTMTESIACDHACAITNGSGGTATINGQDLYGFTFTVPDTDITVGASGTTDIIRFTAGKASAGGDGVLVDAAVGSTTAEITFYYCDFDNAQAQCGLSVETSQATDLEVHCYNCRGNTNPNDGFAINSSAGYTYLNLYDCSATANTSQGATCHNANEVLKIEGGSYYSNGASGIGCAGGAIFLYDADVYSNTGDGFAVNITGANNFVCYVDSCYFYGNGTACLNFTIDTGAGRCTVTRSDLNGASGTESAVLIYNAAITCNFYNTIIRGVDSSANYGLEWKVDPTEPCSIDKCVIYGNVRGMYLRSHTIVMTDTIVSGNTQYGMDWRINPHYQRSLSRNNIFYGNASNYVHRDGSSQATTDAQLAALKSSDENTDPQFVNAASGDFKLKTISPCLNDGLSLNQAGTATGKTSQGAWQPKYAIPLNKPVYSGVYGNN